MIDTKKLADESEFNGQRQLQYYLTSVPVWTLRSSGDNINVQTISTDGEEYSLPRSCFDGEGNQ